MNGVSYGAYMLIRRHRIRVDPVLKIGREQCALVSRQSRVTTAIKVEIGRSDGGMTYMRWRRLYVHFIDQGSIVYAILQIINVSQADNMQSGLKLTLHGSQGSTRGRRTLGQRTRLTWQ